MNMIPITQNNLGGYILLDPNGKVIHICDIANSVAKLIQIKQQLAKHHIMTDLITLDCTEFQFAAKQLDDQQSTKPIYQFTDKYDDLYSIKY